MKAFTFGLTASIRSRQARTSSTGESLRALSSGASSEADLKTMSESAMLQDSLRRLDGAVDFKFTERPQLRELVLERRLDGPQPLVAQVGSIKRGNIEKNFHTDRGLCRVGRSAAPGRGRQGIK